MIKYFCDRCGKEINGSVTFHPTEFGEPTAKNVDFRIQIGDMKSNVCAKDEYEKYKLIPNLLCEECKNDFFEWCKERR